MLHVLGEERLEFLELPIVEQVAVQRQELSDGLMIISGEQHAFGFHARDYRLDAADTFRRAAGETITPWIAVDRF